MAAAFATILTSHESSAIGSVTRQVPTPDQMFNMLATDLRTAVPTTVRRGLTTGSAPTKSSFFFFFFFFWVVFDRSDRLPPVHVCFAPKRTEARRGALNWLQLISSSWELDRSL